MTEQSICVQIIESLRKGVPPKSGIERYSVGNEKLLSGIKRHHLSGIRDRGIIRFLSGSWGAGKTHFFRQLRELAFHDGLLVSTVELDVNNAALDKFQRVFYAIVTSVETPRALESSLVPDAMPFAAVLKEALVQMAEGDDAKGEVTHEQFAKANEKLMSCRGIDIDFKKIVKQYWETFFSESPDIALIEQSRAELLQWFAGEGTVGSYRKRFGVTKMVSKDNAKLMLQSLAEFVQLAGYKGLLILFDEAEQAYSIMRKSSLRAAHNNLLSLINNIESLGGLFLLYATTPDFYNDPKHGIVIYGALSGRIGKPADKRPRALDTVWNLDSAETTLQDFTDAAQKIVNVYSIAYPEIGEDLPTNTEVKSFVKTLHEMHPRFEALAFWRVLVSALTQFFDDHLEGDVRPPEKVYEDVMDRLRED